MEEVLFEQTVSIHNVAVIGSNESDKSAAASRSASVFWPSMFLSETRPRSGWVAGE